MNTIKDKRKFIENGVLMILIQKLQMQGILLI